MSKYLLRLLIVALVVIPLAYGLMPNTNIDKYGNPIVANTESQNSEQTGIFPKELSGMTLVGVQQGEEAMQGVNQLHGLDIEIKNAYIATYQKDTESAIIWISESNNAEEANQLFKVMDEKMPNNESFTEYHKFEIKGQQYSYVFWPKRNMHNYFYVIGTKNYWVAVGSENPMPFLAEVLKNF